jgi:3-phenylpropionate/trans-cinnamate dioxygenase ferredoxin subunit
MDTVERRWIKIAESEKELSFHENDIAEVETEERRICVAKFEGQLFAFNYKCPHASALFIDSYIDAKGNVVCPLHRYKFCIRNGRNVSGEGYFLKHWPVEVREDGVFVGFEKNKLFGLI